MIIIYYRQPEEAVTLKCHSEYIWTPTIAITRVLYLAINSQGLVLMKTIFYWSYILEGKIDYIVLDFAC